MKKVLSVLLILAFFTVISSSEEVFVGEKRLRLLKVKGPTAFEFEEIGFARLAGVSGMRTNDKLYEDATKVSENILKKILDEDGKLNIRIYKSEKEYKDGNTRVYHYVVIPVDDKGNTLEHVLVSKGIASVNSHTKKYFDKEKLKELQKQAKEKKLFKWKDD